MTDIDYYVFPLSPYCYLAGVKLEAMAENITREWCINLLLLMELFDETGGVRTCQAASIADGVSRAGIGAVGGALLGCL